VEPSDAGVRNGLISARLAPEIFADSNNLDRKGKVPPTDAH